MMGATTRGEGVIHMGLLDKVKAQATTATEMAKDAAAKGQAKMNELQAKKVADGMLRDLGAAFYATKTGRSTPSTDAEIAQLVTSLQSHESEHGQITLAPESAAGAPTASPADGGSAAPAPPPPPPPPTA
jgi:thioesterase domain-containing protein